MYIILYYLFLSLTHSVVLLPYFFFFLFYTDSHSRLLPQFYFFLSFSYSFSFFPLILTQFYFVLSSASFFFFSNSHSVLLLPFFFLFLFFSDSLSFFSSQSSVLSPSLTSLSLSRSKLATGAELDSEWSRRGNGMVTVWRDLIWISGVGLMWVSGVGSDVPFFFFVGFCPRWWWVCCCRGYAVVVEDFSLTFYVLLPWW